MEGFFGTLDGITAWLHTISLVSLILFPFVILVWTILEGRCAAAKQREEAMNKGSSAVPPTTKPRIVAVDLPEPDKGLAKKVVQSGSISRVSGKLTSAQKGQRQRRGNILPTVAVLLGLALLARFTFRSAFCQFQRPVFTGPESAGIAIGSHDRTSLAAVAAGDLDLPLASAATSGPEGGTHREGGYGGVAIAAFALCGLVGTLRCSPRIRRGRRLPQPLSGAVRSFRAVASAPTVTVEATAPLPQLKPRRVRTPDAVGYSSWHDIDLHVKNWLDEDTGLLRYVNEMPMGTLQKFEVQPDAVQNAIVEDLRSSERLQAFGQAVPFNYGCFPQTYRDPGKLDSKYGAPGDDDPLDVIDLSDQPAEAGAVVQCRPLGAVCLIDEGQADWKVLVVNAQDSGPLANARCVEDIDRIMPGRLAQCLRWMDDFKNSAGKDSAELQTEIHSADWARTLVEEDHASWKSLVAEANSDGTARGHWICANSQQKSQPGTAAMVMASGRSPSSVASGQTVKEPAPLSP